MYTDYWIDGGYIFGPEYNGEFWIEDGYIYGPDYKLPWFEQILFVFFHFTYGGDDICFYK